MSILVAHPKLQDQPHAQRERLAYIDYCLEFFGSIARGELMERFGTAVASSTRDFSLYRELAPQNLVLRHEDKRYHRTGTFQPLFRHHSEVVLSSLARGFGDGISTEVSPSNVCEDASGLIFPPSYTVASLMRAITQGKAVQAEYMSHTSGSSLRTLVPHTIVNNGQRWYVRSYDRKRQAFLDFVCTRFISVRSDETEVEDHELRANDAEWNQMLTLELVPHPSLKYPDAIALDFNMISENGSPVKRLDIRVARAGYLLRYWNVDCSPNHCLPAHEHHLWLRNNKILKNLASTGLALGYSCTVFKENLT